MAIIKQNVCSNCGLHVPEKCDGRVYKSEETRDACIGTHGLNVGNYGAGLYVIDGKTYLKIVVGHGNEDHVEMREEGP